MTTSGARRPPTISAPPSSAPPSTAASVATSATSGAASATSGAASAPSATSGAASEVSPSGIALSFAASPDKGSLSGTALSLAASPPESGLKFGGAWGCDISGAAPAIATPPAASGVPPELLSPSGVLMFGCDESGAGCEDVGPGSAGVEFCSGVDWFGPLSPEDDDCGGGGGPMGASLCDELCPPSAGVEFGGGGDESAGAELMFWS